MVVLPFQPSVKNKTVYTDISSELELGPYDNPALVLVKAASSGMEMSSMRLEIVGLTNGSYAPDTGYTFGSYTATPSDEQYIDYVISYYLPPGAKLTVCIGVVVPDEVVVIEFG